MKNLIFAIMVAFALTGSAMAQEIYSIKNIVEEEIRFGVNLETCIHQVILETDGKYKRYYTGDSVFLYKYIVSEHEAYRISCEVHGDVMRIHKGTVNSFHGFSQN